MLQITDDTRRFILQFEGILEIPHWPGGSSGITIGVGYDLGYVTVDTFESDWGPFLNRIHQLRLRTAVGKRGIWARNRVSQFSDICIRRAESEKVFQEKSLPGYALKTEQAFPGIDQLPAGVQTALISLVYNRGTSMEGERRREMRAIQTAVLRRDLPEIADQLRKMKRLWIGKGLDGLLRRRDAEANLVATSQI